jgi:hypothetical protein
MIGISDIKRLTSVKTQQFIYYLQLNIKPNFILVFNLFRLNTRIKLCKGIYVHSLYGFRYLTVYIVMWVYITWEEQTWEYNSYKCVYNFKRTASKAYEYNK